MFDILGYMAHTCFMSYKVTVQENGRVVLPAAFRKALGLARGERHQLMLDIVDGQGVIRTELDQVRTIQARFRRLRTDTPATDDLSTMRREESRNEI